MVHDDAELRVARVGVWEVGVVGEYGRDEHDEPDERRYDGIEEVGAASTTWRRQGKSSVIRSWLLERMT